jgi:hypothetical protein
MSLVQIKKPWKAKPPFGKGQQNPFHPLSKGLIGRWLFNERAGNALFDLTRNRQSGVIEGATWELGRKLYFDGIDDQAYIPDSPEIAAMGDGSFTISAGASSTNTTKTDMYIVRRDNADDQGAEPRLIISLDLENVSSGETFFVVYDGTNAPVASTATNYTDGIRHHFVGVRDVAADKVRLYIDGILVSEVTDTTTGTVNTQRQPYTIGNVNPITTANGHMDGYIDDVRFYNRALSSEEIMQIYTDPYQDLKPRSIWVSTAAVIGFNPYWARPKSSIINGGIR